MIVIIILLDFRGSIWQNTRIGHFLELEYKLTQNISGLESQVLSLSQSREQRTLASGELVRELRWSAEQERKVLSRLASKGLIVRVRKGLYLVPARLPLGGKWSPGEFLALTTLIEDRGGRYQISGPNTFYRYGWTEQIPNRVYAYNNRISGDRQVGPVALTLIQVTDERLGGTEVVRVPEGIEVVYASKARSLVDAVHDWLRFDTLPRAYGWIEKEIETDGFAADLVEAAIQFGNLGTLRRIGAVLKRLGVAENLLGKVERRLNPSTAFIPLVPGRERRGRTRKRWGVVINDE